MATNLFRIYRTGADIGQPWAAPDGAGGVYVAESNDLGDIASLARISSSGSIAWNKDLTIPAASGAPLYPQLSSSSTHVVLGCYSGVGFAVAKFTSAGVLVWQTALPMESDVYSGGDPYGASTLSIGPSGEVFVTGKTATSAEALLIKLDASTGAVTWSVNLRDNSQGASGDYSGVAVPLSGGDVIVHVRGALNYVQRLSGGAGAVVWSKGVVWPSGQGYTGVGVDPSDNIYLTGTPTGTPKVLPVVKLDSSGATLWNRRITCPSGFVSLGLDYKWSGRLTADSSGVYIPAMFRGSSTKFFGHAFVPEAGTVAAGTALLATFNQIFTTDAAQIGAGGGTNTPSVFATLTTDTPNAIGAVVTAGSAASEDGTWGAYTRTTRAFDVDTGSATVTTQTYTRASMPSFTASSVSYTDSTGTLQVEAFTPTYNASSLGPTSTFGTPRLYGYVNVDPYTPSTSFGTPVRLNIALPTSVAPATAFGTPALSLNKTVAASSISSTTTFGLPWAERDPVPRPFVALPTEISTTFGRPSASGGIVVGATSVATTTFGTPAAQVVVAATGSVFGSFGTPTIRIPVRATSVLSTTTFGLAMRAGFGGASSLAPGTAFGTPSARAQMRLSPASIASTTFGTPSCLNTVQRARSGVFRTRWGLPQAERTAP